MKQTRLKIVGFFGICLVAIAITAMFKDMEGVASLATTGVAGIVAHYMHSETKRKSVR